MKKKNDTKELVDTVCNDRRKLLKQAVTVGATGLVYAVAGGSLFDSLATAVNAQDAGDQKYRYGMVIDTRRCVGCRACTVSCKAEHKTPPGVSYTNVHLDLLGDQTSAKPFFTTKNCYQCQNPFCVVPCPVPGATFKRSSDGIVVVDYDLCIGCEACIPACPYENRYMDHGDNYPAVAENTAWAGVPAPEYSQFRVRKDDEPPIGKARKCMLCMHMQDENGEYDQGEGRWPSCAKTCTGHAIHFGDFNDPESDVSQLLHGNNVVRYKENSGTEPNVFYIV